MPVDRTKLVAAAELAAALLLFLGCNVWDVVPLSETPWIFLLGWASLRLRGRGWRSVGLARPPSWPRALALAAATAVGLQLASIYVVEPLFTRLTGRPQDLSEFAPLVGNWKLALAGFVVVWTLAAFGEELVYRGYILNRAADLGSGTRAAWIASLLAVSVLFGLGHLYQGPTGVVDSTISGLVFGSLYLASGRNLWTPILAHGLTDTIALLLVYFDRVPNVHL